MRITILLPGPCRYPAGGYKVALIHAAWLAQRGHRVHVLLPLRFAPPSSPYEWALRLLIAAKIRIVHRPLPWLHLPPQVRVQTPLWLSRSDVDRARSGDGIILATSWNTAESLMALGAKSRVGYFIQGLEDWDIPRERLVATWKAPFRKVAISKWLVDAIGQHGELCEHVPNGIDCNVFRIEFPPENRRTDRILMLHHTQEIKGTRFGLEALALLHRRHAGLRAGCFGVSPRPADLPDWIEYEQMPSPARLCALYNQASIFLAPSLSEGWGLTPIEAMACGTAVVASDIGGHRENGRPGINCLMTPPGDSGAMADAASRLIENSALRIGLAHAGRKTAESLSWESACTGMEDFLASLAGSD